MCHNIWSPPETEGSNPSALAPPSDQARQLIVSSTHVIGLYLCAFLFVLHIERREVPFNNHQSPAQPLSNSLGCPQPPVASGERDKWVLSDIYLKYLTTRLCGHTKAVCMNVLRPRSLLNTVSSCIKRGVQGRRELFELYLTEWLCHHLWVMTGPFAQVWWSGSCHLIVTQSHLFPKGQGGGP